MKKYRIILVLTTLFAIVSCERNDNSSENRPAFVVYKTREDYTQNVCIGIKEDGKIFATPSPFDNAGDINPCIIKLINGYYLDYGANYGLYSAYLSITRESYHKILNLGSVKDSILDSDPYLEYYEDENRILEKNSSFVIDTARLRQIIQNNELSTKLKRLK